MDERLPSLCYFGKSVIVPTGSPPNHPRQPETPFSVPNVFHLDYAYILMLASTPFIILSCVLVFCFFFLRLQVFWRFLDRDSVSCFCGSFCLQGPMDLLEVFNGSQQMPVQD